MQTRQQKGRKSIWVRFGKMSSKDEDEYLRLAKSSRHWYTCGLVQAIAYVHAKDNKARTGETYLDHLSGVMVIDLLENTTLEDKSRKADLMEYQFLSLEAIEAATWLKRYAEALLDSKSSGQPSGAETSPESGSL